MVKKLLKYEFISYLRTLTPMYLILLAIGLFNRVLQFFENDHFSYDIVFISSLIALIISAIVCLVMTEVIGITRFYKNLYSSEGYLSFTLPVTAGQHLFTKLFTLIVFTLLAFVATLASLSIAAMGEMLVEIFKAAGYLFKQAYEMIGIHTVFFIIEVIVMLLVALIYGYLLYYSCITIGQTAKKNRILAAFGVYFVYYAITQVFGTIIAIVGMIFGQAGVFEALGRVFEQHPIPAMHGVFLICTVFYAALAVAFYFINRYFMNKKLNLE